jgi:hypothetical protein
MLPHHMAASRWRIGVVLVLSLARAVVSAQQHAGSAPLAQAPLTDAQKERFLLTAKVLSRRSEPRGGTGTERVTLSLNGLEHEAHVQAIEGYDLQVQVRGEELGLRDNWRNNVAAYRLDRLLGLGMVPVTVDRRDDLYETSFTWWVDDFLMDERSRLKRKLAAPDAQAWDRQLGAVRIFDQLIYNLDRNTGNVLIDEDWRVWIIGHSRAFRVYTKLQAPKSLGARCPRGLLDGLRRLDKLTMEKSMTGLLDSDRIDGLLARRDTIVGHFEKRIAEAGEQEVLYDLPARSQAAR